MQTSTEAGAPVTSGRRVAISAGSLAVLLGALDTYVVVTIMTDIMRDVGIGINQIQRVTPIVTVYLLGYIAAMPLLGRASDRFGRKLLLQASLAGFAVGSVVTAMSTDLDMLVIGRLIQGIASGALLPVTLALAADLWTSRNRAAVLGGVGAAQELGSVLGPIYGIALVWLFHHWQSVFWVNVPLALIAMVMIHFSLPSRQKPENPEKVDVVGGLLLALTLGLATWGLYNPAPDGKQVLPSNGALLIIGALRRGRGVLRVGTVRPHPADRTRRRAFPAVPRRAGRLVGRGRGADGDAGQRRAVRPGRARQGPEPRPRFCCCWFLIALPIGALLGGWIATRIGDRIVACAGLLIAAGGYYLVSGWPADVLSAHHDLGFVTLPMLDTDLAIAGLGLGLVIAPLTSATLRVVPAAQHGIASAAVVVARMIGMLIGVAALSAWGLYKFNQYLQERLAALPPADPRQPGRHIGRRALAWPRHPARPTSCNTARSSRSPASCASSVRHFALLISGRHEHADEPVETVDAAPQRVRAGSPADDNPTQAIETPTHQISSQSADETARLEQPRGHHRPE